MGRIVQARIDASTERILARLRRRTGLTDSEILRRALAELDRDEDAKPRRRVIGLGRFASGRSDLGADKRHLAGFGRS